MPLNPRPVEPKDPDESKVYAWEWSDQLGTATITQSTWTLPNPLVNVTSGISTDGQSAVVQISGGEADQDYDCVNTIVTSAGETLKRTGVLPVRTL